MKQAFTKLARKIITPSFVRAIEDLRTWDMDVRQMITDSAVKEVLGGESFITWRFRGMEIIIDVARDKLQEVLRENLIKHLAGFNEAMSGWIDEVEVALTTILDDLKHKGDADMSKLFALEKPVSHAGEYETLLGMLELTTMPVIQMNQLQYQQYVQDEWAWSATWKRSNTRYLKAF